MLCIVQYVCVCIYLFVCLYVCMHIDAQYMHINICTHAQTYFT